MRSPRFAIVAGVLVALSAVVAGFVIFSDAPQRAPRPSENPAVAVSDGRLVVGPASGATYDVVVREDFGCAQCRAFDVASRDFLRIEAARGTVQVTYVPTAAPGGEYAAQALAAFQDAAASDPPRTVLTVHDELFDRQPTPAPGTAGGLPTVSVDGEPLAAADGTELATALQTRLVEGQR